MSRAVENANAKFQVTPTPVTHADVKKEICEALGLDERNAYEQISLEKESLDKPILTSIRTELNPNSEALKSRISSFEKELSNDRERWLMKEIESIYKENRPCFIVYGYGHLQVNHNRLIEMTSY